jgi:tetratricopeptide (TPR) repeat protein
MKCQWSPQKAKQDKKFIAERLSRVFISKGEYDQAISIIESIPQKKLEYVDYYILHTWALAMLKSNRIAEVQTILDIAKKSKRNKEPWLTHFLKGCAYLESDEIELAQEQLELAHQAAERVGKKTVDSLLIAKAFVSYKSDKESEALKYLKEAQKLSPYRVSIGERISKWQQSKA